MKNLKLILAAAVVILTLSACQNFSIGDRQPIGRQPVQVPTPPAKPPVTDVPSAPATALAQLCAGGNGNWLAEFEECENVAKEWCEAKGGKFDECGSACRHNPKAEVCTMQCVPFCSFKATPPLVGGDKDAHGCIGSAGYMWCEPKTKCLRIWEEACWPEVTAGVMQAFSDKYKRPLSEIRVSVGMATDAFAKGGVGFGATDQPGEGGNFLAAKVDGKWKIVFDGNGSVACKTLEPYKFPADMVRDFCAD